MGVLGLGMASFGAVAVAGKAVKATATSVMPTTQTITGTMAVVNGNYKEGSGVCWSGKGYEDISKGTRVTVRDGSGNILATSSLGSSQGDGFDAGVLESVYCNYPFSVTDVPKADFYEIEVGRRGSLEFSYQELADQNWAVSFNLG
ncbi:hypothetical protein [Kineococcus auxinigenes]|uniref:hypothetical protein n=1 Tax=unclassified Kineococcus TaxID=2621656 RepID=UPI003D7CE0A7